MEPCKYVDAKGCIERPAHKLKFSPSILTDFQVRLELLDRPKAAGMPSIAAGHLTGSDSPDFLRVLRE
jgi:hypothetical protein